MDTLADVLAASAVAGSVAASLAAGEPWGLRLDAVPGAAFHAVAAGTAWLRIAERPPLRLMPGDAVLLPSGAAHDLLSDLAVAPQPFDHAAAEAALERGVPMAIGPAPAGTQILCASYQHDPAATLATFGLLPEVVHVRSGEAPVALRTTLQLLAEELHGGGAGTRAVLDHVVNVLLIQVLRAWVVGNQAATSAPSWLRGLADPVTRAALAELHRDPGRPWTTEDLARRAGVSRATLGRRFAAEVGHTPGDYLTTWRMELAARRLRTTDDPVGAVARAVGYTSEYAFNRAFARRHGIAPGRYRSRNRKPNWT